MDCGGKHSATLPSTETAVIRPPAAAACTRIKPKNTQKCPSCRAVAWRRRISKWNRPAPSTKKIRRTAVSYSVSVTLPQPIVSSLYQTTNHQKMPIIKLDQSVSERSKKALSSSGNRQNQEKPAKTKLLYFMKFSGKHPSRSGPELRPLPPSGIIWVPEF